MEENCRLIILGMAYHCYKRLNPWAQAKYGLDDLFQEGAEVLYSTALPRYRPGEGTRFGSWLRTCLRSHYANIVKKENHYHYVRSDEFYDNGDGDSNSNGYSKLVAGAVYKGSSPEDAAVFRQAVEALLVEAPELIELVLGEGPWAWRCRRKLYIQIKRLSERKGSGKKGRITGRKMAKFLNIKNLADLRKIFYNTIKGDGIVSN